MKIEDGLWAETKPKLFQVKGGEKGDPLSLKLPGKHFFSEIWEHVDNKKMVNLSELYLKIEK